MGPNNQNGSQNGSPETSGRPWGAEAIFERLRGPCWHPLWLKNSTMVPNFARNSSTGFERQLIGQLVGPWARLGVDVGDMLGSVVGSQRENMML